MENILLYQELNAGNDVNGNPRVIINVNILSGDKIAKEHKSNHNMHDTYYIEKGYRSPFQVVKEGFSDIYVCKQLPKLNITAKEYKRLQQIPGYVIG